jgi:hypothetical protein
MATLFTPTSGLPHRSHNLPVSNRKKGVLDSSARFRTGLAVSSRFSQWKTAGRGFRNLQVTFDEPVAQHHLGILEDRVPDVAAEVVYSSSRA